MENLPDDDAASHLAPGFLVGGGRFALLKQIGEGGMGTVWVAQDERLDEKVALKFLSAAFRNDATALSNLRKETQKSRKLTHPNITRIHDLYEAPGELAFISMEFVDGTDLAKLKAQQPHCIFSWEFLQPIVKQLCDALDYAHGEDVIHRDLKPSNMMLDAKGRLKLADFGLAAFTREPYSSAHPEGYWAGGTINYMSPQQLAGWAAVVSDDIYALGATLYELLTSRTPFYVGDIAEQARTIAAMPITDRLEEFELKNEIPRDVRALVMACLAKEPEKRPESARAVAEWIGFSATSTPAAAQTIPTPTPVTVTMEAEAHKPALATEAEPAEIIEEPRSPNRRLVGVVVAVTILALLSTAGWFAFRSINASKDHNLADVKPYRTIDTSFNCGTGANVEVRAIAVQKDGKVLLGGRFTMFNEERHVGFVRLNRDGSIDSKTAVQTDGVVWSLALQPDEKILIAGDFSEVNGVKHQTVARLKQDLTIDDTFDCDSARKYDVRAILAANDKIFAGGPPMMFHGAKFERIAQLDMSGNPVQGIARANGNVWALAIQTNGQLLVGGEFNRVTGAKRAHLMRLNTDGQADNDFAPNPNQRVFAVVVQPDGKILVGGSFDRIAGAQMRCIARLNSDGAIDTTFNPGLGADSSVQAVALQADGKILIGGTFHEVDGAERGCVARLNRDGTVDRSFAPNGISVVVRAIAMTSDGNILVGGGFTNIDGVERRNIAQLRAKP